jgi:hypothetical protein
VDAAKMSLEEIRLAGLRALSRDLGVVGMVRFLQQFETGHGDYTEERHHWLSQFTVSEVVQELQERRRSSDRSEPGE